MPVCAAILLLACVIATDGLAARGGGGHAGGHARSSAARAASSGAHYGGGGHVVPHFRAGVFIGAPLFAPLYLGYPPPYPYYPVPFVTQVIPPVYIEQYPAQQPQAQMAPAQPSSWHFCQSSATITRMCRNARKAGNRCLRSLRSDHLIAVLQYQCLPLPVGVSALAPSRNAGRIDSRSDCPARTRPLSIRRSIRDRSSRTRPQLRRSCDDAFQHARPCRGPYIDSGA